MSRFTRHGSAVRCEGDPFATCVDETAAMMVLNALRALEDDPDPIFWSDATPVDLHRQVWPGETGWDAASQPRQWQAETSPFVDVLPDLTVRVDHHRRRENDEYACTCGLRWALDDDDPHPSS